MTNFMERATAVLPGPWKHTSRGAVLDFADGNGRIVVTPSGRVQFWERPFDLVREGRSAPLVKRRGGFSAQVPPKSVREGLAFCFDLRSDVRVRIARAVNHTKGLGGEPL